MSAHVLLNLLNELGKRKCEACRAFYLFFATSLINYVVAFCVYVYPRNGIQRL